MPSIKCKIETGETPRENSRQVKPFLFFRKQELHAGGGDQVSAAQAGPPRQRDPETGEGTSQAEVE